MSGAHRRAPELFCCCIITIAALFFAAPAHAFKFGEHKMIGDTAFARFMADTTPSVASAKAKRNFFRDTLDMCSRKPFTDMFSGYIDNLTYGDLTGLSADHGFEPVEIFDDLLSHKTALFKTLQAHMQAIAAGDVKGASDAALTAIDIDYPIMGAVDKSHFYHLGESLHTQLGSVSLANITALQNNFYSALDSIFTQLLQTNSVAKYATLHAIAMELMFDAGVSMSINSFTMKRNAVDFINKALLFNAFADHFLQDAFAGGHLAVVRSGWHVFDDMGTHNFYCRLGLDVRNAIGESWHTFGDGFIDDPTFRHAVSANVFSLNEIWKEFLCGYNHSGTSLLDSLSKQSDKAQYLLSRFGVFNLVPQPVDPAKIKFADSRMGLYVAVHGGVAGSSPAAGLKIGLLSYNFSYPQQLDSTRESMAWAALNVGYAHTFSTTSPRNQFWFGLEGIFSDCICVGVDLGTSSANRNNFGMLRPAIGYEFKPISWSFAPSLHISWEMIAQHLPAVGVGIELRYY